MKRINFVFGVHNHQPIGNFDFVFEEAFNKSYLPFIETLEKFPTLKIVIHYSGILLDWLDDNRPEFLLKIKEMAGRGQLEILTGGYYEPILSIIPEEDRIGQIQKLTKRVNDLFGYDPQGIWLAERVWEPTLPSTFQRAGIQYTVIDDTHFKYAGLTDKNLTGYFLTEDLGNATKIFPISKQLRYAIPFQDPEVTIAYLRSLATDEGENIVVFADDGEKFGVWPKTFHHVYTEKWLERFFQLLVDNADWINTTHFCQMAKQLSPVGKIYLPTASYAEMMHWALFPVTFRAYESFENYLKSKDIYEDVHIFVRGGFWRNFFAKYSEVNNMHKKMLYVSNKLHALESRRGNKIQDAMANLWAGQCNCPYWHGVFGGLYLSHLRDAVYANLIDAEKAADEMAGVVFPVLAQQDLNVDGYEEIITETEQFNAYFSPSHGGMLYELDYKPLSKNILDTMTRREEGYHGKLSEAVVVGNEGDSHASASIHDLVLAKEPDLISQLHYDNYERKSFLDHFIGPQTSPENFATVTYEEVGDFLTRSYDLTKKKRTDEKIILKMHRNGSVHLPHGPAPVKLEKTFNLINGTGEITADYLLTNEGGHPIDLWFGVEFNFGLQAGHADDRYYYLTEGYPEDRYLDSKGVLNGLRFIGLRDEWRKLDIGLEVDRDSDFWRFPIETISLSEGGFEKVYQSSVVFANWKIKLDKSWRVRIKQNVARVLKNEQP